MSNENVEKPCWFYINSDPLSSYKEPMNRLASKDVNDRVDALDDIVKSMINDESVPDNLMITVIQNCSIVSDIRVKKLLLLFWEAIEKKNKSGKLREEFILVCNSLRKDLAHPNEYLRGRTLRLLSKLPYPEILESLKSVLFESLTHKHAYVRSNALQSTLSVIKNFGMDVLPPNTIEKIRDMILKDPDSATKRNAYIVLAAIDPRESLIITRQLLIDNETNELSDLMILSIIDNISELYKTFPNERTRLMRMLKDLEFHKSNSVRFEIANKLIKLTSNPNMIRTSIQLLCGLLSDQKDNNTLISILKILFKLKNKNRDILEEQIISFATIIEPNLTNELKKLLFDIISELIRESNITQVFDILVKNFNSVKNQDNQANLQFKNMILNCMFNSIIKYPIVPNEYWFYILEKCLLYSCEDGYVEEHVSIIKNLFIYNPNLTNKFVDLIISHFEEINSPIILQHCIWILSEYSNEISTVLRVVDLIISNIGDLNLFYRQPDKNMKDKKDHTKKVITKTVVKEDGTYGTETVVVDTYNQHEGQTKRLRKYILQSNFFFSTNLVVYLTKLVFFLLGSEVPRDTFKRYFLNVLQIICAILKMDSSLIYKDPDNVKRIELCLNFLIRSSPSHFFKWLSEIKIFGEVKREEPSDALNKSEEKKTVRQVDDAIVFRHVKPFDADNLDLIDDEDVSTESTETEKKENSKLIEVLTGSEDPLLVEASVEMFTFDIVIHFLIKNKTKNPLQNITIDLFAPTNLEIIERAPQTSLGPYEHKTVRSCIKFSSSCNSYIFGQINYADTKGKLSSMNLSGVFIDLLNTYPADISEHLFRKLWIEYNWENTVMILSKKKSQFRDVIQKLITDLHFKLIIPNSLDSINEECKFLVANLYTKSKLGEDALINLSIEKVEDKKIVGQAVVRSKVKDFTQYLGDKVKDLIK